MSISKTEINALDKLLTSRNIEHKKSKRGHGCMIYVPSFEGYYFRVICDDVSRGHDYGLLEVDGFGRGIPVEPVGYLHAEEVMELIEVIVT